MKRYASVAARIHGGVGRWLASRAAAFPVASADLGVELAIGSAGAFPPPPVHDGLDLFRQVSAATESSRAARRLAAATRIGAVSMVASPQWREAGLLRESVKVRGSNALSKASGKETRIRHTSLLRAAACRVRTPGWEMPSAPAVLTATARLAQMPQMRAAEPLECLSLRDCDGYVREAQVQRGLPEGSELLAVFRRVPIEGVAKLRFLEQKKLLFFTMSPGRRTGTCRVHDLAAVRDAGGTTHLVPHRTRFRTVVLG